MAEPEVGIKERGLDFIGGCMDSMFLSVLRVLRNFKPKRRIDRLTYEKQIDFYFDNGYVDHPETFFSLPENVPAYKMLTEKPFRGGIYQLISFHSGYIIRNPLIREKYNSYEANRTAYLHRWIHGDRGRKIVLCLHGYMLGEPVEAFRMFKVHRLFDVGLDAALFITPFHWKRAPASRFLRGIFLQPDNVVMSCECVGQAMHDLSQSMNILQNLGASETGIIGASLGGYLASLFACLTDRISFAVMVVPAVNFSGPLGPQSCKMAFPIEEPLKEKLAKIWELHSPLNMLPKISKERILFIASRGDRLCPFENVLAICKKWGWPGHCFLTGGHSLIFDEKERGKAWYRFLEEVGFL